MRKTETGLILILCLAAGLGYLYFQGMATENKAEAMELEREYRLQAARINSFRDLGLKARSAIVFDPNKGESVYSLHESFKLPLASVTKVMTALVALEKMPSESAIPITWEALSEEGDNGLFLGERWTLSNLVKFMLASSSNDAAKAISAVYDGPTRGAFIAGMNGKAFELNLNRTQFYNENGLDLDLERPGAVSSAKDTAHFIYYFYLKFKDVFEASSKPELAIRSEDGIVHKIKNTNILLSADPNIKASKTGFTDLAGGNLAVVFEARPGYNLVAVVLGSTPDGRFADIAKLMYASRRYLNALQN